jgi:hypothetical protein
MKMKRSPNLLNYVKTMYPLVQYANLPSNIGSIDIRSTLEKVNDAMYPHKHLFKGHAYNKCCRVFAAYVLGLHIIEDKGAFFAMVLSSAEAMIPKTPKQSLNAQQTGIRSRPSTMDLLTQNVIPCVGIPIGIGNVNNIKTALRNINHADNVLYGFGLIGNKCNIEGKPVGRHITVLIVQYIDNNVKFWWINPNSTHVNEILLSNNEDQINNDLAIYGKSLSIIAGTNTPIKTNISDLLHKNVEPIECPESCVEEEIGVCPVDLTNGSIPPRGPKMAKK